MVHKHPPGIFAHPRIHHACVEQPLHKVKGPSIHCLLAYLSYQASHRRSFSNYPPCLQPPTSIRVTQRRLSDLLWRLRHRLHLAPSLVSLPGLALGHGVVSFPAT